ncbi:hypothetical protein P3L51_04905 [Streptomyces sp. PSRA5]|uniref:hypothetical protein n=1 Tax=Streptomyces panacea TaxID=3035064 RepID=UPI00339BB449
MADRSSLRSLAHTARRLAGLPILVALASRGDGESAQLDGIRRSRCVELLRPCVPPGDEQHCDPDLLVELALAESRVDTEAGIRHLTPVLERVSSAGPRLTALGTLAYALARTDRVGRARTCWSGTAPHRERA